MHYLRITFISLDTFKDEVHNIDTKRDAWLKFLTEDDPDEIAFRQNPKELINMFSDALKEMDKNTERYMVEELNKKVKELNEELSNTASVNDALAAQNNALITQNDAMTKRIAELEALLHESQS